MSNTVSDFYSQHFEVSGFIREVFGYMDRFKGQLFVLKIEDGLMDHPLFPVLGNPNHYRAGNQEQH